MKSASKPAVVSSSITVLSSLHSTSQKKLLHAQQHTPSSSESDNQAACESGMLQFCLNHVMRYLQLYCHAVSAVFGPVHCARL